MQTLYSSGKMQKPVSTSTRHKVSVEQAEEELAGPLQNFQKILGHLVAKQKEADREEAERASRLQGL